MSDTLSTITTTATSPHPLTLELLVLFYRIIHPLEHQNVHLLLCHLQMLLHFCNYTTNSFIYLCDVFITYNIFLSLYILICSFSTSIIFLYLFISPFDFSIDFVYY